MKNQTEDQVREKAGEILGLDKKSVSKLKNVKAGVGQLTTFNQLGYKKISDKPDGWYLPDDKSKVALILETKSSDKNLNENKWVKELLKNCNIIYKNYDKVVGILYNGDDIRVFKNGVELENQNMLHNKEFYFKLFSNDPIDKQKIYNLTKNINDLLHVKFGIKNLYHRMIFTACALVAVRYNKPCLSEGMDYDTLHTAILSQVNKSLENSKQQNIKVEILTKVYSQIEMNRDNSSGDDINQFIKDVSEISKAINSNEWRGEDVMGIFFNEFNRYKSKTERGQVFTPEHITSFMYRLLECNKDDFILDATCGSGGFLVKAMSRMIQEAGGVDSDDVDKIKSIKQKQLFGIEFDKEIYALACANMLIHKDGKTNLMQMDSTKEEACEWIKTKPITKVLMNPPYETKYGCMKIVENVLNSVQKGTRCAFILPDKKLEKAGGKKLLKHNTLTTIIKLPENLFFKVGITTSIYIFESGNPQNNKSIIGYYIEDDGLETVKNQGRQDIKNKWANLEDYWVKAIHDGNDKKYKTRQLIDSSKFLSYQMPKKEFKIYEEDFIKTTMDYLMYEKGIDVKSFSDRFSQKVMYSSEIKKKGKNISINIEGE